MPDPLRIDQLPAAAPLTGAEAFPAFQAGATKQGLLSQILAYIAANLPAFTFPFTGLPYSPSLALDFSTGPNFTLALTGNVSLSSFNLANGREVTVVITSGAGARNFSFPAGWQFIGSAAPVSIAANRTAILTLTSTGTTEAGVLATYEVTPDPVAAHVAAMRAAGPNASGSYRADDYGPNASGGAGRFVDAFGGTAHADSASASTSPARTVDGTTGMVYASADGTDDTAIFATAQTVAALTCLIRSPASTWSATGGIFDHTTGQNNGGRLCPTLGSSTKLLSQATYSQGARSVRRNGVPVSESGGFDVGPINQWFVLTVYAGGATMSQILAFFEMDGTCLALNGAEWVTWATDPSTSEAQAVEQEMMGYYTRRYGLPLNPSMLILGVGDSLTYGAGATDNTNPLTAMAQSLPGSVVTINRGQPSAATADWLPTSTSQPGAYPFTTGSTSTNIFHSALAAFQAAVAASPTATLVLVVMLDTNDANTANVASAADHQSHLQTLCAAFMDAIPTAKLQINDASWVAANSIPNGSGGYYYDSGSAARIQSYEAANVAARHALSLAYPGRVIVGDTTIYAYSQANPTILADGVHWKSYAVMGQRWATANTTNVTPP